VELSPLNYFYRNLEELQYQPLTRLLLVVAEAAALEVLLHSITQGRCVLSLIHHTTTKGGGKKIILRSKARRSFRVKDKVARSERRLILFRFLLARVNTLTPFSVLIFGQKW
jgi:hypothetical protein